MKKYLMIVLSLACGLQITSAAFAANLSPYQYNPKQPPVEIDLGTLDEAEIRQRPPEQDSSSPALFAPDESAEVSQPGMDVLTPQASAPQYESAPGTHTAEFLDKVMAYHLPQGVRKRTIKARASVTPPAPPRKPSVPVAETPKAETAPEAAVEETKPVAEPTPAAAEAPKAEEKPAEAQAAAEAPPAEELKPVAEPAPAAAEAPKAEEKPLMPVVQERRRKTPETAVQVPAEMTVAFEKTSSELSPAAQKDLDALIAKIKDMPDLRIQLRAYATDTDGDKSNARRMSLSRGLMVRSYLTEKGISPTQLDVRALGAEGDAPPSDQVELVFVK